MTQTVLTADTAHSGPGGGGVAGECPGLLTGAEQCHEAKPRWISLCEPAQHQHQLSREDRRKADIHKRRSGQTCHGFCQLAWNCPIYCRVFGSFSIHSKCTVLLFRLGLHLLYQNLSGRQRRRWQHCQQFFVPLNITRSSCSGSSPPQRYRCLQTSI